MTLLINGKTPEEFMLTLFNDVYAGGIADVAEAVDRYYTPDAIQEVDGEILDRTLLIGHVVEMRARVKTIELIIHDLMFDGTMLAQRHTVCATKPDGDTLELRAHLFVELRDGRICRVYGVSRVISGKRGSEFWTPDTRVLDQ